MNKYNKKTTFGFIKRDIGTKIRFSYMFSREILKTGADYDCQQLRAR